MYLYRKERDMDGRLGEWDDGGLEEAKEVLSAYEQGIELPLHEELGIVKFNQLADRCSREQAVDLLKNCYRLMIMNKVVMLEMMINASVWTSS